MREQQKVIAVGDVHGRDFWKRVLEKESDFDKFIFVGDYFDNFKPHTVYSIYKNWQEIVQFKRRSPEKVVLLIGNHDYQYMGYSPAQYSGYNPVMQIKVQAELIEMVDNRELVVAHLHENVLFSHAGVGQYWYKEIAGLQPDVQPDEAINQRFLEKPELFDFIEGGTRDPSGDDIHQGPLWIRPDSVKNQLIDNQTSTLVHAVGHSYIEKMSVAVNAKNQQKLILMDCPNAQEYLVIENGEISPRSLLQKTAI